MKVEFYNQTKTEVNGLIGLKVFSLISCFYNIQRKKYNEKVFITSVMVLIYSEAMKVEFYDQTKTQGNGLIGL